MVVDNIIVIDLFDVNIGWFVLFECDKFVNVFIDVVNIFGDGGDYVNLDELVFEFK